MGELRLGDRESGDQPLAEAEYENSDSERRPSACARLPPGTQTATMTLETQGHLGNVGLFSGILRLIDGLRPRPVPA